MKLFKKKFSVRIRRYYQHTYTVDYAHYRFLKLWNEVTYWRDPLNIWDTEGWHPILFSKPEGAESFAKSQLNSYDDVIRYYIPQLKKENDYLERRKEFFGKSEPYETKIIK
jgi:hypothetical protein